MAQRKADPEDLRRMGQALKRAREARGLTQPELADRIGATKEAVSVLERGVSGPSFGMLFAVARALEASWDELLGPPPSSGHSGDEDWTAGRRAGLVDAIAAVRELLEW